MPVQQRGEGGSVAIVIYKMELADSFFGETGIKIQIMLYKGCEIGISGLLMLLSPFTLFLNRPKTPKTYIPP